jgi:hypothetical protein
VTAYGALSTMNWSDPNAWLNLGIKLKDLVADPANATSWVQTARRERKAVVRRCRRFLLARQQGHRARRRGAASTPVHWRRLSAQDVTVSANGQPRHPESGRRAGIRSSTTLTSGNTDSGSAGFGGSYHQFNLTGGSDATIAAARRSGPMTWSCWPKPISTR